MGIEFSEGQDPLERASIRICNEKTREKVKALSLNVHLRVSVLDARWGERLAGEGASTPNFLRPSDALTRHCRRP